MHPRPTPIALAFTLVTLATSACGTTTAQREPDQYLGCGTDENWRTLDDFETSNRVKKDAALAPKLTAPTPGALTQKPRFTWDLSSSAAGQPNGTAVCDACARCGQLGPAHQDAVSGDLYDLHFVATGTLIWRALTTQQYLDVTDDLWAALRGKAFTLRIVRAGLKVNDVADGPFEPLAPIAFTAN